MPVEIPVKGKSIFIYKDVINRDIATFEKQGKVGKYVDGVYHAERPNIHGMLTCLRDNRKFDSHQIESVCMGVCPYRTENLPVADDSCHLDDCWKYLFNGLSLDGKTRYVEFSE